MPLVTTSVVASELLPKNSARKSLVLVNESAADTVYIKKERSENTTVSSTDHDIRLGPGAGFSLNNVNDGKEAIQGRYTVVASANAPVVSVFETEENER